MRTNEPAPQRLPTVTVPARPLATERPAGPPPTAAYARKRAELDATLERLLLMPHGREPEGSPFEAEYRALAERRRALVEELRSMRAQ
jgi:hypothetical protein